MVTNTEIKKETNGFKTQQFPVLEEAEGIDLTNELTKLDDDLKLRVTKLIKVETNQSIKRSIEYMKLLNSIVTCVQEFCFGQDEISTVVIRKYTTGNSEVLTIKTRCVDKELDENKTMVEKRTKEKQILTLHIENLDGQQ